MGAKPKVRSKKSGASSRKRPRKRTKIQKENKPKQASTAERIEKLSNRINGEMTKKKKRRTREARPDCYKWRKKKSLVELALLPKEVNDGSPYFEYGHKPLRGRILRVGTGSVYVEIQYPYEYNDEGKKLPTKYESYHISRATKVYPLIKRKTKE